MREKPLHRYTNLAAALHILRNKCITLLNPDTWDDRNDAFFVAEFKKQTRARSVLALCFAETDQTYHHWRVFSPGSDGLCLEFDKKSLLKAIQLQPTIHSGRVKYLKITNAARSGIPPENLPFRKRYPYRDEKEFRLLYVDHNEDHLSIQVIPCPS